MAGVARSRRRAPGELGHERLDLAADMRLYDRRVVLGREREQVAEVGVGVEVLSATTDTPAAS